MTNLTFIVKNVFGLFLFFRGPTSKITMFLDAIDLTVQPQTYCMKYHKTFFDLKIGFILIKEHWMTDRDYLNGLNNEEY